MTGLDAVLPHTGSLIRRAQQRHAAEWARLVSPTITSVQYAALAILADRPGASQRELGDALEVDRSTIADLAARLERHGLVARAQDKADRRRYVLALTSAGLDELQRLRPRADLVEQAMTRSLTAAEVAELRRLLHGLLDA
ncbi:MarR family winged helix-turn-helix transcriptional regulator [Castellaniella defragrans]|uniref:Transcriptional regulator, MarR family n=2 Tax=Castellaniella defragrans TaxID=75697 RepID=W8WVX1_CASD6|nr:MarR family transcriptional regulator [Castellaniella defragrans]KAB0615944.1 MarR family transcriptional regulator [Castellaniella defragrans]MBB6085422.1 DNA-binding MarR family transcriptional regulator [Castellaniella defragrans]CDM23689.1 Transcriptional regulator, MarR family [Castellaniella defragrans 65Phen]